MKNPHKRYSRTITCTDEEWDPIQADANRRGKSASEWFVECALTEEVTPKQAAPRKLVLDAKAQRSLSRDVAEFARGSHADGDGTSRFADNLHALFETPLRTMAREAELRDALEAAGVPPAALEVRGQGFKDGAEDVRAFRRACAEGKVAPSPSLLLRSAMAEARTISDPAGNAKLCKGSEGGRRMRAKDDAAAAAILAVSAGVRSGLHLAPRGGVYMGMV